MKSEQVCSLEQYLNSQETKKKDKKVAKKSVKETQNVDACLAQSTITQLWGELVAVTCSLSERSNRMLDLENTVRYFEEKLQDIESSRHSLLEALNISSLQNDVISKQLQENLVIYNMALSEERERVCGLEHYVISLETKIKDYEVERRSLHENVNMSACQAESTTKELHVQLAAVTCSLSEKIDKIYDLENTVRFLTEKIQENELSRQSLVETLNFITVQAESTSKQLWDELMATRVTLSQKSEQVCCLEQYLISLETKKKDKKVAKKSVKETKNVDACLAQSTITQLWGELVAVTCSLSERSNRIHDLENTLRYWEEKIQDTELSRLSLQDALNVSTFQKDLILKQLQENTVTFNVALSKERDQVCSLERYVVSLETKLTDYEIEKQSLEETLSTTASQAESTLKLIWEELITTRYDLSEKSERVCSLEHNVISLETKIRDSEAVRHLLQETLNLNAYQAESIAKQYQIELSAVTCSLAEKSNKIYELENILRSLEEKIQDTELSRQSLLEALNLSTLQAESTSKQLWEELVTTRCMLQQKSERVCDLEQYLSSLETKKKDKKVVKRSAKETQNHDACQAQSTITELWGELVAVTCSLSEKGNKILDLQSTIRTLEEKIQEIELSRYSLLEALNSSTFQIESTSKELQENTLTLNVALSEERERVCSLENYVVFLERKIRDSEVVRHSLQETLNINACQAESIAKELQMEIASLTSCLSEKCDKIHDLENTVRSLTATIQDNELYRQSLVEALNFGALQAESTSKQLWEELITARCVLSQKSERVCALEQYLSSLETKKTDKKVEKKSVKATQNVDACQAQSTITQLWGELVAVTCLLSEKSNKIQDLENTVHCLQENIRDIDFSRNSLQEALNISSFQINSTSKQLQEYAVTFNLALSKERERVCGLEHYVLSLETKIRDDEVVRQSLEESLKLNACEAESITKQVELELSAMTCSLSERSNKIHELEILLRSLEEKYQEIELYKQSLVEALNVSTLQAESTSKQLWEELVTTQCMLQQKSERVYDLEQYLSSLETKKKDKKVVKRSAKETQSHDACQAQSTITELWGELVAVTCSLSEKSNKIHDLENTILSLEGKILELEHYRQSLLDSLNVSTFQAESTSRQLWGELLSTRFVLSQRSEQVCGLENQVSSLETKIKEYEAERQSLQETLNINACQAESTAKELQVELAALTCTLSEKSGRIYSLENILRSLEEKIVDMELSRQSLIEALNFSSFQAESMSRQLWEELMSTRCMLSQKSERVCGLEQYLSSLESKKKDKKVVKQSAKETQSFDACQAQSTVTQLWAELVAATVSLSEKSNRVLDLENTIRCLEEKIQDIELGRQSLVETLNVRTLQAESTSMQLSEELITTRYILSQRNERVCDLENYLSSMETKMENNEVVKQSLRESLIVNACQAETTVKQLWTELQGITSSLSQKVDTIYVLENVIRSLDERIQESELSKHSLLEALSISTSQVESTSKQLQANAVSSNLALSQERERVCGLGNYVISLETKIKDYEAEKQSLQETLYINACQAESTAKELQVEIAALTCSLSEKSGRICDLENILRSLEEKIVDMELARQSLIEALNFTRFQAESTSKQLWEELITARCMLSQKSERLCGLEQYLASLETKKKDKKVVKRSVKETQNFDACQAQSTVTQLWAELVAVSCSLSEKSNRVHDLENTIRCLEEKIQDIELARQSLAETLNFSAFQAESTSKQLWEELVSTRYMLSQKSERVCGLESYLSSVAAVIENNEHVKQSLKDTLILNACHAETAVKELWTELQGVTCSLSDKIDKIHVLENVIRSLEERIQESELSKHSLLEALSISTFQVESTSKQLQEDTRTLNLACAEERERVCSLEDYVFSLERKIKDHEFVNKSLQETVCLNAFHAESTAKQLWSELEALSCALSEKINKIHLLENVIRSLEERTQDIELSRQSLVEALKFSSCQVESTIKQLQENIFTSNFALSTESERVRGLEQYVLYLESKIKDNEVLKNSLQETLNFSACHAESVAKQLQADLTSVTCSLSEKNDRIHDLENVIRSLEERMRDNELSKHSLLEALNMSTFQLESTSKQLQENTLTLNFALSEERERVCGLEHYVISLERKMKDEDHEKQSLKETLNSNACQAEATVKHLWTELEAATRFLSEKIDNIRVLEDCVRCLEGRIQDIVLSRQSLVEALNFSNWQVESTSKQLQESLLSLNSALSEKTDRISTLEVYVDSLERKVIESERNNEFLLESLNVRTCQVESTSKILHGEAEALTRVVSEKTDRICSLETYVDCLEGKLRESERERQFVTDSLKVRACQAEEASRQALDECFALKYALSAKHEQVCSLETYVASLEVKLLSRDREIQSLFESVNMSAAQLESTSKQRFEESVASKYTLCEKNDRICLLETYVVSLERLNNEHKVENQSLVDAVNKSLYQADLTLKQFFDELVSANFSLSERNDRICSLESYIVCLERRIKEDEFGIHHLLESLNMCYSQMHSEAKRGSGECDTLKKALHEKNEQICSLQSCVVTLQGNIKEIELENHFLQQALNMSISQADFTSRELCEALAAAKWSLSEKADEIRGLESYVGSLERMIKGDELELCSLQEAFNFTRSQADSISRQLSEELAAVKCSLSEKSNRICTLESYVASLEGAVKESDLEKHSLLEALNASTLQIESTTKGLEERVQTVEFLNSCVNQLSAQLEMLEACLQQQNTPLASEKKKKYRHKIRALKKTIETQSLEIGRLSESVSTWECAYEKLECQLKLCTQSLADRTNEAASLSESLSDATLQLDDLYRRSVEVITSLNKTVDKQNGQIIALQNQICELSNCLKLTSNVVGERANERQYLIDTLNSKTLEVAYLTACLSEKDVEVYNSRVGAQEMAKQLENTIGAFFKNTEDAACLSAALNDSIVKNEGLLMCIEAKDVELQNLRACLRQKDSDLQSICNGIERNEKSRYVQYVLELYADSQQQMESLQLELLERTRQVYYLSLLTKEVHNMEEICRENAMLRTSLESLTAENKEFRSCLQQCSEVLESAKSQLVGEDANVLRIWQLESELCELRQKSCCVEQFESQLSYLARELNAAASTIAVQSDELAATSARLLEKDSTITYLAAVDESQKTSLSMMACCLEERTNELRSLAEMLSERNCALNEKTRSLSQKDVQISELCAQLSGYSEMNVLELYRQLTVMGPCLSELTQENEYLSDCLSQAVTANETLTSQTKDLTERVDLLTIHLTNRSVELINVSKDNEAKTKESELLRGALYVMEDALRSERCEYQRSAVSCEARVNQLQEMFVERYIEAECLRDKMAIMADHIGYLSECYGHQLKEAENLKREKEDNNTQASESTKMSGDLQALKSENQTLRESLSQYVLYVNSLQGTLSGMVVTIDHLEKMSEQASCLNYALNQKSEEVGALRSCLQKQTEDLSKLSACVEAQSREIDSLNASVAQRAREVENLEKQSREKDEKVQSLQKGLESKEEQMKDLSREKAKEDNKANDMQKVSCDLQVLQSENQCLRESLSQYALYVNCLNETLSGMAVTIDHLEKMNEQASCLNFALNQKSEEVGALKCYIQKQTEDLSKLSARVEAQTRENDSLKASVLERTREVENLEKQSREKDDQVKSLQKEVDSKEEKMKDLSREKAKEDNSQANDMQKVSCDLQVLQSENQCLRESLSQYVLCVNSLKETLNGMAVTMDHLEKMNEQASCLNVVLSQKSEEIGALKSYIQKQTEDMSKLSALVEAQTREIESLKASVLERTREVENLEKQSRDKDDQVKSLQKEVDSKEEKFKEFSREIEKEGKGQESDAKKMSCDLQVLQSENQYLRESLSQYVLCVNSLKETLSGMAVTIDHLEKANEQASYLNLALSQKSEEVGALKSYIQKQTEDMSKLSARVEAQTHEIDSLKASVLERTREVEHLEKQSREKDEQVKSLQREVNTKEEKFKEFSREIEKEGKGQENDARKISCDLQVLQSENQYLRESLSQYVLCVTSLKETLSGMAVTMDHLERANEQASCLNLVLSQKSEEVGALKSYIQKQTEDMSKLSVRVEAQTREIDTLKASVMERTRDVEHLEKQSREKDEQVKSLQKEVSTKEEKFKEFSREIEKEGKGQENDARKISCDLQVLQSENQFLRESLSQYVLCVNSLKGTLSGMAVTMDHLEKTSEQVSCLNYALSQKSEEVGALKSFIEKQTEDLSKLSARVEAQTREMDLMNVSVLQRTREVESLEKQSRDKDDQFKSLQKELDSKEQKIKDLSREIEAFKSEVSGLKNTVDNLKNDSGQAGRLQRDAETLKDELARVTCSLEMCSKDLVVKDNIIADKCREIRILAEQVACLKNALDKYAAQDALRSQSDAELAAVKDELSCLKSYLDQCLLETNRKDGIVESQCREIVALKDQVCALSSCLEARSRELEALGDSLEKKNAELNRISLSVIQREQENETLLNSLREKSHYVESLLDNMHKGSFELQNMNALSDQLSAEVRDLKRQIVCLFEMKNAKDLEGEGNSKVLEGIIKELKTKVEEYKEILRERNDHLVSSEDEVRELMDRVTCLELSKMEISQRLNEAQNIVTQKSEYIESIVKALDQNTQYTWTLKTDYDEKIRALEKMTLVATHKGEEMQKLSKFTSSKLAELDEAKAKIEKSSYLMQSQAEELSRREEKIIAANESAKSASANNEWLAAEYEKIRANYETVVKELQAVKSEHQNCVKDLERTTQCSEARGTKIKELKASVAHMANELRECATNLMAEQMKVVRAEDLYQHVQEQLAELKEEKNKLAEDSLREIEAMEQTISCLRNEKQELEQTISSLRDAEKEAEQTINSLKNDKQDMEKTILLLEQSVAALKVETQEKDQAIASLKIVEQEMEHALTSLKNEKHEMEKTIFVLNNERSIMEQAMISLKSDKQEMEQAVASLTNEKHEMEKTILVLNNERSAMEQAMNSLKSHTEELEQAVASLKNEKQEMEKTIVTLNNERSTMEQAMNSLKSDKEELEQAVTSLKNEKHEMEKTILVLNNEKAVMEQAMNSLKSDKEELVLTVASLRNDKEELGRIAVSLRDEKQDMQNRLREVAEELAKRDEQQRNFDSQMAQLKEALQ